MQVRNGIVEAIGNTPLIKLERASELTGCTILGKAEFMNPGQSVKDRAALFIIKDAVESGTMRPGGTVVEGTAGNTEPNGAICANQWDNVANRRAHIETTADEIWADTDGKVDGFVSAVGSGGTLGGVSDGLKA